jgi:putative transposase
MAAAANQLRVAAISYLRTWQGFVYLAIVVDAFSRKVVGWAMADHLRTNSSSRQSAGPRDSQPERRHGRPPLEPKRYTSCEFGRALDASGLLVSMGRVGPAFDNALAESVFATLKTEFDYRRSWPSRHELEMEVFSCLKGFYNTRRRHFRLNNLSSTTTRPCT